MLFNSSFKFGVLNETKKRNTTNKSFIHIIAYNMTYITNKTINKHHPWHVIRYTTATFVWFTCGHIWLLVIHFGDRFDGTPPTKIEVMAREYGGVGPHKLLLGVHLFLTAQTLLLFYPDINLWKRVQNMYGLLPPQGSGLFVKGQRQYLLDPPFLLCGHIVLLVGLFVPSVTIHLIQSLYAIAVLDYHRKWRQSVLRSQQLFLFAEKCLKFPKQETDDC